VINDEFVKGFISCMDGERDPINLDCYFKIFPILSEILNEEIIKDNAEELFDVISCYFPITFNSNSDDPTAITAKDLSNNLM
jgi:DNA repair/transcription protein MET18/MMS19